MTIEKTKQYTVGFIFNSSLNKVLLVHKTKPVWQDGRINGIGGKFEEDEDMFECIVRETQEESTLVTKQSDWKFVGILLWPGKEIHVLTCIYNDPTTDAQQNDYEQIEWFPTNALPDNILENLNWLVPMSKQVILGHSQGFTNCIE